MRLNKEIKDPVSGTPINDGTIEIIGIGNAAGLFDPTKDVFVLKDANDGKQDGESHMNLQLPPFANGRDCRVKG